MVLGDNGILSRAENSSISTKFASYNEELGLNAFDEEVYATGEEMKDYIPSMEEKYFDSFAIVKTKLLYIGTNEKEAKIAENLGIGSMNSGSKATIEEIQSIINGVIGLKDEFPEGEESSDNNTENGLIGKKLINRKEHLYDGTWDIIIDYDKENKQTARYEEGYYWLKENETYTINEKSLKFQNNYVVNYEKKEF